MWGQLKVVDLTRKGLDDYAPRNLSNGEFQGVVFVRSVSEAVFTTSLLRLMRQDRLDIDGMAAHLHGAAPPDNPGNRLLILINKTLKISIDIDLHPFY